MGCVVHWSLITLLVSVASALDCEVGWAGYNGECFHFSKSSASWQSAQDACRQLGGYLATDDNQEKHDFLTNMASVLHSFGESVFWIGADDYLFEGQWRWEETGGQIASFTKWAPGAPSTDKGANCIGLIFMGQELYWKDMPCGNTGHHGKRQISVTEAPTAATTKHHNHHTTHKPRPPSPNHYYICEKQMAPTSPVIG